jgi:hypothetical protein
MDMEFADRAWWEMVAGTVTALHSELGVALTPRTLGHLLYEAREAGVGGAALRAWLSLQEKAPAPQPAPAPAVDAGSVADTAGRRRPCRSLAGRHHERQSGCPRLADHDATHRAPAR